MISKTYQWNLKQYQGNGQGWMTRICHRRRIKSFHHLAARLRIPVMMKPNQALTLMQLLQLLR